MPPVTIKDVAAAAAVSAATVSRALNGQGSVDPALVERVRGAVDALGYRPNGAARSLRRQVSDIWAVIVPDIENPFFTAVVRGLEDVAQAHGLATVLCNADEQVEKERAYLRWALAEQVAGVVIAPASATETDLSMLRAAGIPTVCIDRRAATPTDLVTVDNALGAAAATAHLIERGATNIACVTGPRTATNAQERAAGWRRALRKAGLRPGPLRHADFRVDGGRRAVASLLEGPDRPDGLFVANNLMTVGALDAAQQANVSIPADLLLVGFDEIPWADLVRPTLTCVEQPAREIGHAAAQRLAALAAGSERGDSPETVVLAPTLTIRQSTTPTTDNG